MFKSKKTMLVTIFLIFLITISIIKNKTRLLEKEIYELSKKIAIKEKELNDIELDFYYLTSPVIIEKKIQNLNDNNYSPMEYSKIFLETSLTIFALIPINSSLVIPGFLGIPDVITTTSLPSVKE